MSQASKNVDWCLKKAEQEIKECKKLGKRLKHRGLIKTEPNIEEAKNHIKKAEENILFANSIDLNQFGFKAIESLFYSFYHCFLAIAARFGYESGNQTCTMSLIEYPIEENKIGLNKKFIDMMKYEDEQESRCPSIIQMREDYTYGAEISVEKNKINELFETCRELIEATKIMIYKDIKVY